MRLGPEGREAMSAFRGLAVIKTLEHELGRS